MTRNEKIVELKKCRETLLYVKASKKSNTLEENNNEMFNEKPKVLVLKKRFYDKELKVA